MALKSKIEEIIKSVIIEPYYLVDLFVSESKIRNKVSIFIDTDQGIEIDECGVLSRMIGEKLDGTIEEKYTLEVSSPGADSPLKFLRQYPKNIGRTLKINTLEGTEIKAKLLEINGEELSLQTEAKKKQNSENIKLNLNLIKDAKVVLSFK